MANKNSLVTGTYTTVRTQEIADIYAKLGKCSVIPICTHLRTNVLY